MLAEDEVQKNAPAPRPRRHGLSIAVWVPILVGLTLVLVLTAFTSLGVAASVFPSHSGRVVAQAGIIPAKTWSEIAAKGREVRFEVR